MAFLTLSLSDRADGLAFDPEKVVARARHSFPALVLPGDQFTAEVQKAEAVFAGNSSAASARVLATLRRQADQHGPAFAFEVSLNGSRLVRGLARRDYVQFLFDDDTPPADRRTLLAFLRTLGKGRLRGSNAAGQGEVFDDLDGDSDCVAQRQEVS